MHRDARVTTAPRHPDVGPMSLLALATLAGMGFGVLDWLAWLAVRNRIQQNGIDFLLAGPHAAWMTPAANVLITGAVAVPVILVARLRPGRTSSLVAATVVLATAASGPLMRVTAWAAWAQVLLVLGGSARASRWILPRLAEHGRRVRRLAIGSVGVLMVAIFGALAVPGRVEAWRLDLMPEPTAGAPNVVLIVLDTVRADATGLHGYGRATTPNLDALAARGVTFERAFAAAPWTLPSHATLFTGRWPHQTSTAFWEPLDEEHPTLAEALAARGYATAGFVGNTIFCSRESGLARGFHHYEAYPVSIRELFRCSRLVQRLANFAFFAGPRAGMLRRAFGIERVNAIPTPDAGALNRRALRWLDHRRPTDRPFFLFLNVFDAHDPYLAPAEFDGHFGIRPESDADRRALLHWELGDPAALPDRVRTMARDGYDSCIRYADQQLGALLDGLERRGLLDETVVIVTSDHGEQFGEHGLYGHANSLYAQLLHVPLVIAGPSVPKGVRVDTAVSLRDVPATILGSVEPGGRSPLPGGSLARWWGADPPAPTFGVFAEPKVRGPGPRIEGREPETDGSVASLVFDGWHYIAFDDGREELYDLGDDPEERRDLAGRETGGRLAEFRDWREIMTRSEPPGPSYREALRARGGTDANGRVDP